MNRTRTVILAGLVTSVLALGACSGDDPQPQLADPTPTASPSGSESPVAAQQSPDGAFAAWVNARNAALRDGDTAAVEALSAPGCTTCEHAIQPIKQVYANGGRFETKGWAVVASRVKSESGRSAEVSAGIKYLPGRTIPESGAEPVVYSTERHIVLVKLSRIDGRWLVGSIGYLS